MNKLWIKIGLVLVLFSGPLVAKEEHSTETADEHYAKAKEHLIEFFIEAVAAGLSVMHGPIGVAIAVYEGREASTDCIEAAKEYNKAKQIEAATKKNKAEKIEVEHHREADHNPSNQCHDHDSWDVEY